MNDPHETQVSSNLDKKNWEMPELKDMQINGGFPGINEAFVSSATS